MDYTQITHELDTTLQSKTLRLWVCGFFLTNKLLNFPIPTQSWTSPSHLYSNNLSLKYESLSHNSSPSCRSYSIHEYSMAMRHVIWHPYVLSGRLLISIYGTTIRKTFNTRIPMPKSRPLFIIFVWVNCLVEPSVLIPIVVQTEGIKLWINIHQ